ncbi:hypothetical protein PF004_g5100 [Phytophthora fragariae]|uniref:Uncharacterized protein n=1 Tax=Phytophthora fragariae TaxID=53985 RepID=A0A6G0PGT2_9STRA|nr:hypothetical protein PF004_g5100 [Phytophthora fragariae]
MFAAGRKAAASSEAGAEGSDAAQAGNDWLSVGKSFPSGTSDDKSKSKHKETEASESVMQVYKHSKHRHKDKKRHKEKKRCDEESCDVAKREKRHLSKHKKKSKDRKRRRSWSRSDSSDGDDTHRSSRRRRRSRSNPRSRSRSRSQSRSDRDENRIVTQSDKTLTPHETEENEKLFEFDSVGDRENRFFGSTYAHDQPLYNLATRRNLLTGAWISQTRPKFSGDKMSGKREEKEESDRYFSMQARKMEKDGRRRRLYLAYSEKRLSRAAATRQGDQGDQTSRTTRLAASCLPEMSFIPVDPILDINKFVANDIDEEPGHVTSTSDDTKEAMLTDGQKVEKEANTSTKTPSPTPGLDDTPGEDSRAAKFLDPATMLLDFHLLMCVFEKKAGYVERSIAQTQALIDFNLNESAADKETGIHVNHLEMLREFGSRWNKDGSVGLGNEQWNTNAGRKSKTSSRMEGGGSSENKRDSSTHSTGFVASDDSETDSRQSGRLIYSNLHGYRINIDDANDAEEYERILRELRGTESARARKDQLIEKEKAKREVLAAAKSQLEDQRADFPLINADDRFMKWLTREEVQSQLQWAPLRSSNPLHQELIERQPDRAILTDEIQPFLFRVPGSYRWRLIVQILHLCGVQWRGENQWGDSLQACQWMYADDAADCELLVNPILSAFNPRPDHSTKHKLFLDSLDRKALLETAVFDDVLVKEDVLRDPSKVAFIRRVFKESLSAFQNVDDKFGSILKCLWIGFEAEVTSATGADETFLMYARGLSQKLVQKSADHDTDFDVLFAYAKLEHKLGNERQVRRICDNTLASLRTPSSSNANLARSFHRFAFLRARIELWPSTEGRKKLTGTLTQDQGRLRVLRCLFTLWNALQPEQQKEKEKETLDVIAKLHRKRLRNYLEELLTSDPSTETDLITRYRAELRYAIWQCTESCPQSCGGHTSVKRSHYQSGCWAGYCLHNLALVVYAYQGFEAACHEYRQGLANAEHQACSHLKWMWTCFLGFMQQHQASGEFPAVAPRAWRSSIGKAVEIFPNEALFLRLFVDAETGNTISQVLRNYFLRVEKRWQRHYDSPELVEWLFSLLCEVCRVERAATIKYLPAQSDDDRLTCCLFHRWGMNNTAVTRIRQTFESMVNHIRTKGNALCWRLYMRFEIALGKVEAAKKVLYRGIAACAWSKALYMDGLRMLRAYLSEDECHEILELLEAKELNVRVDFE